MPGTRSRNAVATTARWLATRIASRAPCWTASSSAWRLSGCTGASSRSPANRATPLPSGSPRPAADCVGPPRRSSRPAPVPCWSRRSTASDSRCGACVAAFPWPLPSRRSTRSGRPGPHGGVARLPEFARRTPLAAPLVRIVPAARRLSGRNAFVSAFPLGAAKVGPPRTPSLGGLHFF